MKDSITRVSIETVMNEKLKSHREGYKRALRKLKKDIENMDRSPFPRSNVHKKIILHIENKLKEMK